MIRRTEEELRGVVSMLCHFIWYRQLREGEHMWTIPVDPIRDFDCILADAIDELVELRARVEALEDSMNPQDVADVDSALLRARLTPETKP